MIELSIYNDKIIDFAEANAKAPSKDLDDYKYYAALITSDSRALAKDLREKGHEELSFYLRNVVLTAGGLVETLSNLLRINYVEKDVTENDTERHYQILVKLANLHEKGTGLAEKYRERIDEATQNKFSNILGHMESELNHANKLFG